MSATQPSAQSYVQLADRKSKAGDIAGAIAALEMAVRLQPNHPAAHYNLALACLDCRLAERAAAGFRRAIALKPDFAHAFSGWALPWSSSAKAGTPSPRSVAPPRWRRSWRMRNEHLAQLLQARGMRDEAAQAYKRAAAAAPRETRAGSIRPGR